MFKCCYLSVSCTCSLFFIKGKMNRGILPREASPVHYSQPVAPSPRLHLNPAFQVNSPGLRVLAFISMQPTLLLISILPIGFFSECILFLQITYFTYFGHWHLPPYITAHSIRGITLPPPVPLSRILNQRKRESEAHNY